MTNATEALVERLAEAIVGGPERARLLALRKPGELVNARRDAEAVLPLVEAHTAAEVEAAVSRLNGEVERLTKVAEAWGHACCGPSIAERERADASDALLAVHAEQIRAARALREGLTGILEFLDGHAPTPALHHPQPGRRRVMDPLPPVQPAAKPWPAALILRGSVVQRVVWGFTRGHARRRASRVAETGGAR